MSDPDIYDEIDDEPKRKGSWEYVHCNSIPVPEHFDDDEVVNQNVTDKEENER